MSAVDGPAWLAVDVGRALGYGDDGKALLSLCRGPWRDELQPDGYDDKGPAPVLSERGLYAILLLCEKPAGRRFRRAIVDRKLSDVPVILDDVIRAVEEGRILFGGRCP